MSKPKPEFYSSEYATWFKDSQVVAAYPSRPPYSEATIELLARLVIDEPRRVLDVGCGPGDLARRLAPLVEHVDAVDFSEGMIATGRHMRGGDAPNLEWILAPVEEAPLAPPYALVTAGDSLHWMEWDIVMPLFARSLTPNGVVAIAGRDWAGPPPLQERLQSTFLRLGASRVRVWQRLDLIEELRARNLFEVLGEQDCGSEPWLPTIDEYLECRHSQRSFSRTHMGPAAAAAFDAEIRELLDDLCAQGVVGYQEGRLQLAVQSRVVWGRPTGETTRRA